MYIFVNERNDPGKTDSSPDRLSCSLFLKPEKFIQFLTCKPYKMKKLIVSVAVTLLCFTVSAQEEGYKFTDTQTVPVTSVKNQASSGTCWSFSGLAFLESEILAQGGPEVDLAEMWIVRNAYFERAVKYVRMHGKANCAAGGATHDVFNMIRTYGIVPEEVYPGLNYGTDLHKHAEMDAVIKSYVDAIVSNPNKSLTTAWQEGLNAILDAYLGKCPETFTYQGKEYTPQSFAASLGVDLDDYISITSFSHHPFYETFALEVPDNWAWGLSYNLPLDEFMKVCEATVEAGHPVLWASDVSEKGFAWNKGLAIVPEADTESMEGTELARWVALSQADKDRALYKFDKPGKEKVITQELRQDAFDRYETTDDHGMEIVGLAVDQAGNKYFKVKNSWGVGNHIYKGYFYASYPFVAYKTTNIMVNKNVLPKEVKKALGIK